MRFSEIRAAFEGVPYEKPSSKELLCLAREHVLLLCEDKGESMGVREARKHLAWYVKGVRGAASFRQAVNSTWTLDALMKLIDQLEADLTE